MRASQSVTILGELFRKGLDRDVTTKFRVLGTPHFPHTSFTQEREEHLVAEFGAGFHV